MANPASAGSLLEQRLTEDVRVTDGLLSVKDPDELDLFILPANAPWDISSVVRTVFRLRSAIQSLAQVETPKATLR